MREEKLLNYLKGACTGRKYRVSGAELEAALGINELLKSQLSAGEQQMFAVAIVWALALTSGYKAPVIIDTPMARLDSSHRANFVTKYLPAASSQVMVLSTDEEVYGRYLDLVRDNVVDYYTLLYREEEQCTSIVHGYFGEV